MSKELVNQLHAAYRSDFEAAKSLVARATDEKRELTAEENAHYERLSESMNNKLAKIEDIQKGEDRAAKLATLANVVETTSAKAIDNDAELLRALIAGEKRSANFQMRALATGTATVPVSFADFLVEALVEGNPVYAGATKIRTADVRNITVPVVAGTAPAAAFIGQGGTITAADPVYSSITLGAYNAATLTLVSEELVSSAGFDIVASVGRAAGKQIAYLAGSACTLGTGTVEPNGFVARLGGNAASTVVAVKGGTAAAAATFFSAADLVVLQMALAPSYRNVNTAWHLSTSALSKVRQLQDTTGRFILEPSAQAGVPERLLGYVVRENVHMAAVGSASKSVAFVHEPSILIREAGSVEVAQSSDRYFEINSRGIRSMYHFDANIADLSAGRILVSANT